MTSPINISRAASSEENSFNPSPPNRFGWRDRSGSGNSAASLNSDRATQRSGNRSDSLHSLLSEEAFPFSRLSTLIEEAFNLEDDQGQNSSFEQIEQQTRVIRRVSGFEEEMTTTTRTIRKVSSLSAQRYSPSLPKRSLGDPLCVPVEARSSPAVQVQPAAASLRVGLNSQREQVRPIPSRRRSSADLSDSMRLRSVGTQGKGLRGCDT